MSEFNFDVPDEPQPIGPEFICLPGESLLSPTGPLDATSRFREFQERTGLTTDDLLSSPLLSLPLPIYPEQFPARRKRWAGVKPEMMWLPLFWLPPRVSGRYLIDLPNVEPTPETNDEWAVRVALEVMNVGLYDEETGTWIDVLAEFGLDISDPAVVERVSAWLDGGDDDVLDAIDLSEYFDLVVTEVDPADDFGFDEAEPEIDPDAKHWGVPFAASLIYEEPETRGGPGSLVVMQWATYATELAELAEDVLADIELDIDAVGNSLNLIIDIADVSLDGVPDYKAHRAQWQRAMDEWDGFEDSLRNSVVTRVARGLREMGDFYDAQVRLLATKEE